MFCCLCALPGSVVASCTGGGRVRLGCQGVGGSGAGDVRGWGGTGSVRGWGC